MTKTSVICFSVSLAHRYWLDHLSHHENEVLFGTSASSQGLGSNFDMEVEGKEDQVSDVAAKIKKDLDHHSFLDQPQKLSSLETLCWDLVQKYQVHIVSLKMKESHLLECYWDRDHSASLFLRWNRPISVIWNKTSGGISGARLNVGFVFKKDFKSEFGVMFPRTVLENELESLLAEKEKSGWQVPDPVNSHSQFLDALFKELAQLSVSVHSITVEAESAKKWLIGSQTPSR